MKGLVGDGATLIAKDQIMRGPRDPLYEFSFYLLDGSVFMLSI